MQANEFAWANETTSSGDLIAFAAFKTGTLSADSVIATARAQTPPVLEMQTAAWWDAYWQESFVTLPATSVEALYYVEMYRFPAADRVVLQGLMGAFGPTDNYNLWPGKTSASWQCLVICVLTHSTCSILGVP